MRYVTVSACLLLSHGAGVVCLSHMEGEKRHKRGRGVMSMPMRYQGAVPHGDARECSGKLLPVVSRRRLREARNSPFLPPVGYLAFPKLGQVSVVAPTATGRGGFGPLVLIRGGVACVAPRSRFVWFGFGWTGTGADDEQNGDEGGGYGE